LWRPPAQLVTLGLYYYYFIDVTVATVVECNFEYRTEVPMSEGSSGPREKVPTSESSWEREVPGTFVPYVDFSLPRAKGPTGEKSGYPKFYE